MKTRLSQATLAPRISLALALACGCVALAVGEEANSAIREELLGVYSFTPHTLTKEEINRKSEVLDSFWRKAKSAPKIYLPVLKRELQRRDAPVFFLYDGSMLLLTLSDSAENRRLALQAIAKCDLRD